MSLIINKILNFLFKNNSFLSLNIKCNPKDTANILESLEGLENYRINSIYELEGLDKPIIECEIKVVNNLFNQLVFIFFVCFFVYMLFQLKIKS